MGKPAVGRIQERDTNAHDQNGHIYSQRERRSGIIRRMRKQIHLHETFTGKVYRWYIVYQDSNLCGTDACIKSGPST